MFCQKMVKSDCILFFLLMKRMASHIQVFALSRWLAVALPIEYSEFTRGLQWSIPYFSLPWETTKVQPFMGGSNSPAKPHSYSSKVHDSGILMDLTSNQQNVIRAPTVYGLPLTPMEYRTFFEVSNRSFYNN